MTEADSEEALRLLRYVVQKVRRYGDATLAGKGVIHAKFNMFGAVSEAEDFLTTLETERRNARQSRWWTRWTRWG